MKWGEAFTTNNLLSFCRFTMAHKNDLTIAQLALKMDAMWTEIQKRFDRKFESMQEQIEQLEK